MCVVEKLPESKFQRIILTPNLELKFFVQDNSFLGGYFKSLFVARVNFESRVKFESGSKFFFFSDYTNDVRAVTRYISFSVGDIFDRKSHYRCVSPLLHQDTRQLSILIHFLRILRPQICAYLKNSFWK